MGRIQIGRAIKAFLMTIAIPLGCSNPAREHLIQYRAIDHAVEFFGVVGAHLNANFACWLVVGRVGDII